MEFSLSAALVSIVDPQDIKRDIREVDSRDELPGDRFHDVMSVSTPLSPLPTLAP